MRWRKQETQPFLAAALPPVVVALAVTLVAALLGVRDPIPMAVLFGAGFALAANAIVTWRGFRAGWKHGIAYLGHLGAAMLLIGIVASATGSASRGCGRTGRARTTR